MQLADSAGSVRIRGLNGPGRHWLFENLGSEPVEPLVKLYIRLDSRPTHASYRLKLAGTAP
jgi:hypothetical protein